MAIFGDLAPAYWAAGLPVIPLRKRSKAPFSDSWHLFCDTMPPLETQENWLKSYPDNNIGLALGPQSGLVAIDLDVDDENIRDLLIKLLPKTPWVRRGKKGAVFMYRWDGHRSFKIMRMEDVKRPILECLSKGNQVVMPGSIHPDTGQAYTATGNLWEMARSLPKLPKDVETLLRQGLVSIGVNLSMKGALRVTEWVAPGARDNSMVALAGLLAREVGRQHRTLEEAYAEMHTWCASYVEKVAGDPIDPDKGCQRILEFLNRDIQTKSKALPKGWDTGLSDTQKETAIALFGEDSEEWSVDQIMSHLDTVHQSYGRGSTERRKGIDDVLVRMSKSQSLTSLDSDQVLQFISQCSGRTMTVGALRKRLLELQSGGVEGTDHTQVAEKLVEEVARFGELKFFADKFWQWKGSHWEELNSMHLLQVIAREFGDLPAARKHGDHAGIVKVAGALTSGELKEEQVIGLNFANGFLTSDLVLMPHEPRFGATYTLPYPYLSVEEDPRPQKFLNFLYQCWGKDADYQDKVQSLREAIAVTMMGMGPRFQRAVLLFGMPHSGKSVLKNIVMGLMPYEAVSNVPPQDWDDKFLPTEMLGKLANSCGELSETELIPGDRFKMMIDGEEMAGQYKGRQIFKFKPMCTHWFASNHMPRTRDSSSGFSRRWLILTFNHAIPENEKVQSLAEDILAEERDQIAAWAVQCLPALQTRNGYTLPESHKAQVQEMATLNNSVRYFIVAGGVQLGSPSASKRSNPTSEIELHNAYWTFCRTEARAQPVSLKVFRTRMTEMQHEFGFSILLSKSPNGSEEASYANITLTAGRTAGLMSI